ncbi:hypothetical protein [uncultured Kordia sp.]|uniref:hypothetical protein n=1 Tax=uncultured Kordia sp. TaxID=507699 RepID=UPI00262A7BBE|nr:hypothetical protein [uncultured Kordia sp.]
MRTLVKNQLFNFVTLRNPQLIATQDKEPGFVFHPNKTQSAFYEAVKNVIEEEKEVALATVSSNFSSFKTKTEVRSRFEKLYDFSYWLMRNKNMLSFVTIIENIQNVEVLIEENELLVWENLIYQTVNKTSVYVREACIQLLIANKFLKAFTALSTTVTSEHTFSEDQDKEFTRRAHASVVISKVLFADVTQYTSAKVSPSMKKLQGLADSFLAKQHIEQYKILNAELSKVEKTYTKEQQELYDNTLKKHQQEVQILIDEATPTIIEQKDENGNVISRIKTYPDLQLPAFSFQKTTPITENYLKDKISDTSLDIIRSQGWDQLETFQEVYTAIGKEKKENYKTIGTYNKTSRAKKVSLRGATLNVSDTKVTPFCFTAIDTKLPTGKHGVSMILGVDESGITVTDANVQLQYTSNGNILNGLSFQNMLSGSEYINVFFEFDPIIRGEGIEIEFSGELTLSNGITYEFSAKSIAGARLRFNFKSCISIKNETPDASVNTNRIYGVSKLGIADFRRVEQEVCCYVPGEVSHIENVMAREYKERETRSLNSVDITNERTEEREVENLTDTTTTERNEMQSEIATVLNEDQSEGYGASAGVNGKIAGRDFRVDSFADFSSSSSISDSNSQAQTHAQEVTERAMERIVQKISTKRTTRILKEFEQKNIHGYDNTKGNANVTGVYRWVDKIYKNSLVNYGKRLMYEFAIPEPSKFFKEAIYKQLENDENVSGAIVPEAPVHPAVLFEIDGVTDIDESNYQEIAAHYGAEVSPKPSDTIRINESFEYAGHSVDNGHETHSENKTLSIPEGYYTTGATVHASGMHDGDVVSGQGISVTVGNQVFHNVNELYHNAVALTPQSGSIFKEFSGELALSFFAINYLGVNATVEVICTLSQEAKQQWQNETYRAIIEAYDRKVQEYNEAQQANEVIQDVNNERISFNPLLNRSLEKREIKRIAIELLTEQKGHSLAKNNYTSVDATTGVAKVIKKSGLEVHASTVKFFEQAFDWDIMAYIFYPYFYASEKDWTSLFQETDAADPLFQAFLQSGMARAVVPVRPGFEEAVNWYMETGEIWNGQGLVIDQDDDLYLSISEEMQTIEGTIEGTWESRIPTSLTILQADSAVLKESGLPCYCAENQEGNPIQMSTDLIGGDEGPTVGGIGKFVVSS